MALFECAHESTPFGDRYLDEILMFSASRFVSISAKPHTLHGTKETGVVVPEDGQQFIQAADMTERRTE